MREGVGGVLRYGECDDVPPPPPPFHRVHARYGYTTRNARAHRAEVRETKEEEVAERVRVRVTPRGFQLHFGFMVIRACARIAEGRLRASILPTARRIIASDKEGRMEEEEARKRL
jgi:hypothetical protein